MEPGVRKLQEGLHRRFVFGEPDGDWTIFADLASCGLSPWEDFVMQWFWLLSTERPPAEGGVREIPYSKIEERLEKLGLTDSPEGEDFIELTRLLDGIFIEYWSRKIREAMKPKRDKAEEEADG